MTITYLETGKPANERAEDAAKVRSVVEVTLKDTETRGDAAVRELSAKFDKFDPVSFCLSPSEIEAAMQNMSTRDMKDIRFALTPPVRRGAARIDDGYRDRYESPV